MLPSRRARLETVLKLHVIEVECPPLLHLTRLVPRCSSPSICLLMLQTNARHQPGNNMSTERRAVTSNENCVWDTITTIHHEAVNTQLANVAE